MLKLSCTGASTHCLCCPWQGCAGASAFFWGSTKAVEALQHTNITMRHVTTPVLPTMQEGARRLYVDEVLPDIVSRHLLPAHATPVTINQERAAAVRTAFESDAAFGRAGARITGMDQRCGPLMKTVSSCYKSSLSCVMVVSGELLKQGIMQIGKQSIVQ